MVDGVMMSSLNVVMLERGGGNKERERERERDRGRGRVFIIKRLVDLANNSVSLNLLEHKFHSI
jgi:hypothetical protein